MTPDESCQDCGNPEAVPITLQGGPHVLCADCIHRNMLWHQSLMHLKELISGAYHDWLTAWGDDPEYRAHWNELYSQMTENLQTEALVMGILAERRMLPKGRKGLGRV